MQPEPYRYYVETPLVLADATLNDFERGEEKLSRNDVINILQQIQE